MNNNTRSGRWFVHLLACLGYLEIALAVASKKPQEGIVLLIWWLALVLLVLTPIVLLFNWWTRRPRFFQDEESTWARDAAAHYLLRFKAGGRAGLEAIIAELTRLVQTDAENAGWKLAGYTDNTNQTVTALELQVFVRLFVLRHSLREIFSFLETAEGPPRSGNHTVTRVIQALGYRQTDIHPYDWFIMKIIAKFSMLHPRRR